MNDVGLLKAALMEIVDCDELGIYPKSYAGMYEKRSEFMEGWNKACIEQAKVYSHVLRKYGILYRSDDALEVVGPCAVFYGSKED